MRKNTIKALSDQLRREARAAAGQEEPAAAPGEGRTAWSEAPPGQSPPGTFHVAAPDRAARGAPRRSQQGSDESYDRRQWYGGSRYGSGEFYNRQQGHGSGEFYDRRQSRWSSSWDDSGESYDRRRSCSGSSGHDDGEYYHRRGYTGSSSSWGYGESEQWRQRSSG